MYIHVFYKEGALLEVATKNLFVFKRTLQAGGPIFFGVPYEMKKGVDLFGVSKPICACARTPVRMCAHAG